MSKKDKISEKLENFDNKAQINFEAYGVRLEVRSNCSEIIEKLRSRLPEILPMGWNENVNSAPEHLFTIVRSEKQTSKFSIFRNGEPVIEDFFLEETEQNWDFVKTQIRMTIAEFTSEYIFLHSGAVGWNGKAIIMPGKSFAGKTTLVKEFVRRGAEYYSDDLTVIDKKGLVHPFPKKLSVRGIIDDFQQIDFDVEELGGKRGKQLIPVGCILTTEYKKDAKQKISMCSVGEGIMNCIANSLSIRQRPAFVLKVLRAAAENAIIVKSVRNEAKDFVDYILRFLKL